jgi:hypothetical protein
MGNDVLPYDKDELYKLYLNAGGIKELATQFSLPKWFVSYELATMGIIDSPKIELTEAQNLHILNTLRDGMREYHSIKNLSASMGITTYALRKQLLSYGIFHAAWVRAKPYQWIESDLKRDFETCKTIKEIANKYNCNRETLIKALCKFGIIFTPEKRRKGRLQYHFTYKQLSSDYMELQSLTAMANKYGCSLYTVWKACNTLGVMYNKAGSK